jgi:hypothetical protein
LWSTQRYIIEYAAGAAAKSESASRIRIELMDRGRMIKRCNKDSRNFARVSETSAGGG